MNSRLARRSIAALLAIGLAAAACSSTIRTVPPRPAASTSAAPTETPAITWSAIPAGSDELAVYEEIQAQVEELRQLPPAPAGEPVLLDETGIREWMKKAFEGVDHESLASRSRLFAHLGLLPEGSSLEQLEVDLNSGQAVGFYDTESKQLFLLSESGGVGALQRLTYSHEYTHAMQDQQFDLSKMDIDAPGQSDRSLARTSLVEGDASLAMMQWAQAHMSIPDLLAVSLSDDSSAEAAQLEAAPAILREDLMFPYTDGLNFVKSVYATGGWAAVDKIWADPPDSTSQILHPELYKQGFEPALLVLSPIPSEVGGGWQMALQDTMGELQLRVWLAGEKPTAEDGSAAAEAVAAWGGDRIGLYEGPDGAWAVVLRTTWRTAAGRALFETAVNARLEGLKGVSSVCSDGLLADVVIASSPKILAGVQTCNPMD
jgi:hypothetical protein